MDTLLQSLIRKIVREEIERRFPVTPTTVATQPTRCSVCGIEFGLGSWGYYCGRSDCPTYSNITAGR